MEEFKKELKELLEKHNAYVFLRQEEESSFLYLSINIYSENSDFEDQEEIIDSGYRDLSINSQSLKI